jgi:hypothetical protein
MYLYIIYILYYYIILFILYYFINNIYDTPNTPIHLKGLVTVQLVRFEMLIIFHDNMEILALLTARPSKLIYLYFCCIISIFISLNLIKNIL